MIKFTKKNLLALALVATLSITACTSEKTDEDATVTSAETTASETEPAFTTIPYSEDPELLRTIYTDYFDIGVALYANTYNKYDRSIYENFSTVTCENEMKWESIQREEGVFTYDNADIVANFARENGQKMRGHTIVWHSQTPAWVGEAPEGTSVDDTIKLMLERIETQFTNLNERYGDIIEVWDVCNEVISDSGSANEIYRQDSLYYKACGSDDAKFEYFISEVFKLVQRINPDVICYYNDYNLEWNQVKRTKTLKFVENVEAYGVDIHGIGFQGHNDITMNYGCYLGAIKQMRDSGLFSELSVTEIDLSVYTNNSQAVMKTLDEETAEKQAKAYGDIFKALREQSDFVTNVTFWGISDFYTWLDYFPVSRNNYPLIFDDLGKKKPAFDAIANFDSALELAKPDVDAQITNS